MIKTLQLKTLKTTNEFYSTQSAYIKVTTKRVKILDQIREQNGKT